MMLYDFYVAIIIASYNYMYRACIEWELEW